MTGNNLYDFLNKISKQRKIKLGDLAAQCKLSRTTLYRYARGMIQIPPTVESKISKVLSMNRTEREEFRRLISLTVQDGSLISSRYVLDNLFFAIDTDEKETEKISFVFHHNDRFLRNSTEMCETFLKHSKKERFRCALKVINCVDEKFLDDLLSMLGKLLASTDSVNVEHLLVFPKRDYLTCTKNLCAVVPLLSFHNYSVFYDDAPESCAQTPFFNNIIIVETSWYEAGQDRRQYFVLSYLPDGLSQCVAFEDEHMFRFFAENYQDLRTKYKNTLVTIKNIPDISDFLVGYEFENEQLVMKGNPCYHKIPMQVYESVLERLTPSALGLNNQADIDRMKSLLSTRYSYAYKKGNIDVYSKSALISFAKSGMLSDHLEGLPPFNEKERKMIFETLREHLVKKSGGYRMYITEKESECIIGAFKNMALLIEFAQHNQKGGECDYTYPFVFIENKMLAEIFFDYATHHIPAYHAIPTEDAVLFLDELIEMVGEA